MYYSEYTIDIIQEKYGFKREQFCIFHIDESLYNVIFECNNVLNSDDITKLSIQSFKTLINFLD
jgi:hypothetical protein